MMDTQGYTVSMQAATLSHAEIIYFLLSRQDINIRIKTQYNEDALTLAIRFCPDDIAKTIIRRGGYTKEVIKAYKLESIFK